MTTSDKGSGEGGGGGGGGGTQLKLNQYRDNNVDTNFMHSNQYMHAQWLCKHFHILFPIFNS